MSQFLQNDDGDLDVSMNGFSITDGQEEVRQRLIQRLKTFLGEWFLDTTIGVPYHQIIFQKAVPNSVVEDLFKSEILATTGVTELVSFPPLEFDPVSREMEMDFEVATPYGEMAVGLEVP